MTTLDLGRIGPALVCDAQGIWVARGTPPVSYPEGGHAACLGVEDASFWFRHRNQCILAGVRGFGPGAEGPFFDVGAGNGFVARALADAGLQVVAVEPGPEGARNARRRGLEHVVCATTDVCGFAAGCAGAAGAFDVIEHMPDDLAFLHEMRRLLAPGGRLFATVPAYGWLWSAEDVEAGHHRRYTLDSITQVLHRPASSWSSAPISSAGWCRPSCCCGHCRSGWACVARAGSRTPARASMA